MQIAVLYGTAVLIWGSTWIAIKMQIGPVAEEVSVAWRFGLASLVLFAYAALSGRRLRIPPGQYGQVVTMGVLMYSCNYIFVYHASAFVTSGLVAVIFSLIVLCNAALEKVFFGRALELRMVIAAILGLGGVVSLFWPEVATFDLQDEALYGAALAGVGVLFASLGNMSAIVNMARELPVIALNAHAMAWGAVSSIVAALLLGEPLNFSTEPVYVWSLAYLAIGGSAIAFGAYIALIRLIGSARAAYTSVLFPLVALLISTFYEGYQWSAMSVTGVAAIIAGNWLALTKIRGN